MPAIGNIRRRNRQESVFARKQLLIIADASRVFGSCTGKQLNDRVALGGQCGKVANEIRAARQSVSKSRRVQL
jgi:bacterioferritin-associated ferredoxin